MTNEQIIEKHGMPESCSCQKCQDMCKTPCIPTPIDVYNIIEHGDLHITKRFLPTSWATGLIAGTHTNVVTLFAPQFNQETGYCSFFKDGLCELHDLGLKPLEGKLASCKSVRTLKESPLFDIIKNWQDDGL